MIVALDATYDETAETATAAAVVFQDWPDSQPVAEYDVTTGAAEPYVPGQFYLRELPCLVEVLAQVKEPIDVVVVDGFVHLGSNPGLGMHLWEAMGKQFPVVGVAKSPFRDADAMEVLRGTSRNPLYVTAVGVDAATAAENVRNMHGPFRIPTMLRRVDRLSKERSSVA
jgi:deoxyribonuclease V